MPTTSQVLQLFLYNNTDDKEQLFIDFRDNLDGPGNNSNMQKIDGFAGRTNDRLTILENLPHTITVKAIKDADNENNFIATIDGFTSYKTNLIMIIYLPENSAGLTTIKINDTDTTSLMKIGTDGTPVNLEANDLKANVGYLFQYDGTQLIALGEVYSEVVYSATQPQSQFTGGIWLKQVAGGTSSIMIKQANGTYLEVPPSTKASVVTFADNTTVEAFKTTVLNRLTQVEQKAQTNATNIQSNLDKINILSASKENNHNLLINTNFLNPVNQRGLTTLTASKNPTYFIDRWFIPNNRTATIVSNGIQVTSDIGGWLFGQKISLNDVSMKGKTITFSAKITCTEGSIDIRVNFSTPVGSSNYCSSGQTKILILTTTVATNETVTIPSFLIYGRNSSKATCIIEWAKLEYGNVATEYIPPSYTDELIKCQYYYRKIYQPYIVGWVNQGNSYMRLPYFIEPMRITPNTYFDESNSSESGVGLYLDCNGNRDYIFDKDICKNITVTFDNILFQVILTIPNELKEATSKYTCCVFGMWTNLLYLVLDAEIYN